MVSALFLPLAPFLFFSEVNTRSVTSEVRKSKEPGSASASTLSPFHKALVSFVYLGRQVTQFCRNVLLSNDSTVLERYQPGARIPAWIRPDKFARHDRDRHCDAVSRLRAFTLTRFQPGNTQRRHDARKRSHNFETIRTRR